MQILLGKQGLLQIADERVEPLIAGFDNPIGKCSATQVDPHTLPVLDLTV